MTIRSASTGNRILMNAPVRLMFAFVILTLSAVAQSQQSPNKGEVKAQQVKTSTNTKESEAIQNHPKQSVPTAQQLVTESGKPVRATDGKCEENKPDKNWMHELGNDPVATFTALLFAATLLLWWTTRALVKGSERTSERQLRAYLHVKRAGASRDSEGILWAKVEIHNFGQTPAYDVIQWIGIVGVSEGDTPNITNATDDVKKAKGIMGPGSSTEFLIPTHDRLTPAKEAALRAGKATIYVFGEIAYRDVFDNPRMTKFKMFLSGEGSAEGLFKNCEDGNDAT
jgi:hypothetical protein